MPSAVVILLGAPGAGKGTQACRLARELDIPHVSTGDLFRRNLAEGTELGMSARQYMDRGALVPDDVVVGMLFDRVSLPDCAEGYLLDGFPRTVSQARTLDERMPKGWVQNVVNLYVDDEVIVERAAGRMTCKSCGQLYHTKFSPPSSPDRCDACGGELYQREDDTPGVVRQRVAIYHEQTTPVVAYYRARGALCEVDGSGAPDEVFEACKGCLAAEA